ncbi:PREDICTED: endoribonuclease Dicer-like [Nicrophorus vespilloides]|uniref:Endoribonuclease Dicer-like n=1 Tax=Nicrophorus vespilloides TaxID=110193 RepID=A0ABM1MQT1_NICVS|nr:PREDICTED: endoribonuclease Dicer-like [Nicrophorus vespilloides]
MDICYYSAFVNEPLVCNESSMFEDVQLQPTRNLAINFNQTFEHRPIRLLEVREKQEAELAQIYQALATAKCRDIVNLERLETLGDSYLKLIASMYIFFKFPSLNEGESTVLKGRLISNRNLFYLSRDKGLGSLVKVSDFSPTAEWLPPGYCVPSEITKLVLDKQLPITALFNFCPNRDEQLSGQLSDETFKMLEPHKCNVDDDLDKSSFSSFCNFLAKQSIRDKTIADVTEALIGVYFSSCGFDGALNFIEWLGLIPKTEEIAKLFKQPPLNPIVNPNATEANLDILLTRYTQKSVEDIIGYKFNNRAFLLQALTHGSYSANRITLSYERLEFIGDAVLDFLITTYIYENCENLDPGKLTDLRSALVNNETFAAFAVRLNLHKHLKYYSSVLNNHIQKFVKYQEAKGNVVNDDVLILLNETDLKLVQHVDVPKVLGDIFESMVGAVYLDSGMDLNAVWKVVYKIMWKEISQFCANIPKSPIRILMETLAPLYPTFHSAVSVGGEMVMVKLDFMLRGSLTRVHGFGQNKKGAKKAAAKIALRLLTPK